MRRIALVLLLLLVPAPSVRAEDPPPPLPQSRFITNARVNEALTVPTRHGPITVRLIRPVVAADRKVPVILTLTAYGALTSENDDLASFFVSKGYARAVADTLGTGNSGGCWDYGGIREREAAHDLVQHLAGLPWANGNVGMIGGSYDGTTANMAAITTPDAPRPSALKTIVPEAAISDWYGYAYGDGVRYFLTDPGQSQGLVIDEQGFDTPLVFDTGYSMIPASRNGAQPDLSGRACAAGVSGTGEPDLYATDKADHTVHGYATPVKDAFWDERDYRAKASSVDIPVLATAGWRDHNVKPSESVRWFQALPDAWLWMTQQAHAAPAGLDFQKMLHAWFDTWLLNYPAAQTRIDVQPRVHSIGSDNVLRRDLPPATTSFSFAGGSYIDSGLMTESRALDERGGADHLWFETEPLAADLRLAGAVKLTILNLEGASQLTPVLFDLGPPSDEARAQCLFTPVQDACTIARGYKGIFPDELGSAVVSFIDNDWTIPAGHRIGLALMSSNAWYAVPRASSPITADGIFLDLPGM